MPILYESQLLRRRCVKSRVDIYHSARVPLLQMLHTLSKKIHENRASKGFRWSTYPRSEAHASEWTNSCRVHKSDESGTCVVKLQLILYCGGAWSGGTKYYTLISYICLRSEEFYLYLPCLRFFMYLYSNSKNWCTCVRRVSITLTRRTVADSRTVGCYMGWVQCCCFNEFGNLV